jgi:NAD-reducing hydrogenase large subunit
VHAFNHHEFEELIAEIHAEWTFAKTPYLRHYGFPQGIVLVGPLSRSFIENGILSDPEICTMEIFTAVTERPLSLEHGDVFRLLEIWWSARRMIQLLKDVKPDALMTVAAGNNSGRGIGVLEAPRGTLVHSYLINRGCIEKMRLYVATQFNNAYISMLIKDIADNNIVENELTPEGEHLIGRSIRIFDPCLSCATH